MRALGATDERRKAFCYRTICPALPVTPLAIANATLSASRSRKQGIEAFRGEALDTGRLAKGASTGLV